MQMSIREALQWARRRLAASPTPHEDARLLLQHVLAAGHTYLAANPEQALSVAQEDDFRTLVARAARLEPVPYLTGSADFCGLAFHVSPAVLIPRPETELLVEAAVAWAAQADVRHIVDVGTGSGCIAVALARRLPAARVTAVDISARALKVARSNVLRHGVAGQVRLQQASLLEQIDEPVDLLAANLPYVGDAEWTALDDGVKLYEPVEALRGGPDGLDLIDALLQQATYHLRPRGAIFLEIGWQQGEAARRVAAAHFGAARIHSRSDYSGHDRLIIVETSNENDYFC